MLVVEWYREGVSVSGRMVQGRQRWALLDEVIFVRGCYLLFLLPQPGQKDSLPVCLAIGGTHWYMRPLH